MAAGGANIIRIDRVADYPVTVLALEVLAPDPAVLRRDLVARCHDLDVDVSVQPRGLARRGVHLVVMDVDSTLIQDEVIEVLARFAGKEAAGPRDHRGGDARRAGLRRVAARPGRRAGRTARGRDRQGAGARSG